MSTIERHRSAAGTLRPYAGSVRAVARAVDVEHLIEKVGSGRRNTIVHMNYLDHADATIRAGVNALVAALREQWSDGAQRVSTTGTTIYVRRDGYWKVPPLPAQPAGGEQVSALAWSYLVDAVAHRDGGLHLVWPGSRPRAEELLHELTRAGYAHNPYGYTHGDTATDLGRARVERALAADRPATP